jgi:hypothetical protein
MCDFQHSSNEFPDGPDKKTIRLEKRVSCSCFQFFISVYPALLNKSEIFIS